MWEPVSGNPVAQRLGCGALRCSGNRRLKASTHLGAYFSPQLFPFAEIFGANFPHGGFFYFGRKPPATSGAVLWIKYTSDG
jgi:hypothetical protein